VGRPVGRKEDSEIKGTRMKKGKHKEKELRVPFR